jgi:hypothetical protein
MIAIKLLRTKRLNYSNAWHCPFRPPQGLPTGIPIGDFPETEKVVS